MSKRKIIKLLLALIFIIAGILIFIYPRVTDYLYKNNVTKLEEEFINNIEVLNKEETNPKLDELYNLLKQENEEIYKNNQHRFLMDKTYDKTDINLSDYGIANNIFGFLEIPVIDMTLPIYFGSSEENMLKGATHLTGTSYPIGGINTNSVIAGHRGYYKTVMLRNIDKIKVGDTINLKTIFGELTYEAYKMIVIKPNELDKLTIKEGMDIVTLISCHPYPTTKYRYVVYLKRV